MNIILKLWLSAAVYAFSALAYAQAPDYHTEIEEAEGLGALIYAHDQAVWHGTDVFLPDLDENGMIEGLKGWVTVPDGRDITVKFVAEQNGQMYNVWDARVRGSKVKAWRRLETPETLTDYEMTLWRARTSPPITEQNLCVENLPLNTVVFPVPNDPGGRIYSYYFASTKKQGEIILGGHYRFTVSRDGREVLGKTQFSNSCLALNPSEQVPKDAKVKAAWATHLRTPHPQEHHVFAQLNAGLTLYIGTQVEEQDLLFEIKNGKIRRVKK